MRKATLPLSPAASSPTVNLDELPRPAPVVYNVSFSWAPLGVVIVDRLGGLVFPPVGEVPGLYAFLISAGDQEEVYIGESDNLKRRFSGYRTPGSGQVTNLRINAILKSGADGDTSVSVAVLTEPTEVHLGDGRRPMDFSIKSTRVFLEHAALTAYQGTGIKLLNRGAS